METNLKHRMLRAKRVLLLWLFLIAGGIIPIIILQCFISIPMLVHVSHGIVGFLLGIMMVFGAGVTSWVKWLVTGRSALDELMFGGD